MCVFTGFTLLLWSLVDSPLYFIELKTVSTFYFTSLTSLFVTVWASEFEMRLLKLCFICGAARDRYFMQTCMTAYVNMNVHHIAQLFYILFVSPCTALLVNVYYI